MIYATPPLPPFDREVMHCVAYAAKSYHVPRVLVLAVIKTESDGKRSAVSVNQNGTRDVGIMQINTIWHETLEMKYNIKNAAFHIKKDTCYNIRVGTWLLSSEIAAAQKSGKGMWVGIGNYHSHSPRLNRQYQNLIAKNIKWLTQNTNWSVF